MSTSVTLPALGESVTEGTVSRWLKQVGDTVEADEPLLEVSTDKVDTEIPSPASGVLLEIKAAEDETVEVGAVLAVIGDAERGRGGGGGAEATRTPSPSSRGADRAGSRRPRRSRSRTRVGEPMPDEEQADPEPPAPASGEQPPGVGGGAASGTEVTLPALGESVTEGTVSRWLKQVGDPVEADEPLLEVSTDKVDTEIPSPTSGTLLEIRVQEDETVEVGAVLAVVGEAGRRLAPTPAAEAEAPSRHRGCSRMPSQNAETASRRPRPEPAVADGPTPASRAQAGRTAARDRPAARAARPEQRRRPRRLRWPPTVTPAT